MNDCIHITLTTQNKRAAAKLIHIDMTKVTLCIHLQKKNKTK